MATYSQIQLYRGRGMTFTAIGQKLGVSRQRVHAIFTGYNRFYRTTEVSKQYRAHYDKHAYPKPECRYCQLDMQISLQKENL